MPPCILSQVTTNCGLPETVGTLLEGAADMVDDQKSTNRAFICCLSFVPEWKWEVLDFAFFFLAIKLSLYCMGMSITSLSISEPP